MDWSRHLIHPYDFENTCISLWTPCLAFGFNKQKLDTLNGQVSAHWCGPAFAYCGSNILGGFLLLSYSSCILNVLHFTPGPNVIQMIVSFGGSLATACYAGNFRSRLREKYNINGSLREDICIHMWCSPCALCQETSELKYQNDLLNDFTKGSYTQGPYTQVMSYD